MKKMQTNIHDIRKTKALIQATDKDTSRFDLNYVFFRKDGTAYATNGKVCVIALNHHNPFELENNYEYIGMELSLSMLKNPPINIELENNRLIVNDTIVKWAFDPRMPNLGSMIPVGNNFEPYTIMGSEPIKMQLLIDKLYPTMFSYWVTVKDPKSPCLLIHNADELIVIGMPLKPKKEGGYLDSNQIKTYKKYVGIEEDPK